MANNTDQIRSLTNKIHLAGALAELDPIKTGSTKDGIPYIRLRGAIQCGPTAVYTRQFTAFIKSKKANGEDSENYNKVKKWAETAVPMTKNKDNPTMVDLVGSLSANDYVNSANELVEGVSFSVQFFNDFEDYACTLDIEGYIAGVSDEERGKDDDKHFTGRKRLRLISMDFYRNVLDLKNIVIPKDLASQLEDNGYTKGRTVLMFITYMPNEAEAKPAAKGFGTQRTTEGRSYLEMVLTGGNEAYDPDNEKMCISTATVKSLLSERSAHLNELKEKGYQGSNNSQVSTDRNGSFSSAKSAPTMSPVDDEDDIPF